jgi:hypothetical protein
VFQVAVLDGTVGLRGLDVLSGSLLCLARPLGQSLEQGREPRVTTVVGKGNWIGEAKVGPDALIHGGAGCGTAAAEKGVREVVVGHWNLKAGVLLG